MVSGEGHHARFFSPGEGLLRKGEQGRGEGQDGAVEVLRRWDGHRARRPAARWGDRHVPDFCRLARREQEPARRGGERKRRARVPRAVAAGRGGRLTGSRLATS
jgi:hypothetical protein